ncbi:alpha/beta hydrolase [Phenylobacterium sp.]|uniref:alpha/beta fold hydrolase n=1 Tax=Phenylobacterium sp. TaxID=1871053 RepID=UPI00122B85A4|nr:alpha/beta hydrolase [Phenylobacterium sp.]THD57771.1 MAG: alpha/beta hydrolase [Phenylobacterium sp.]
MDASIAEPRARTFPLPSRGGAMAALESGPRDRPVDIVFSHANGFNARSYRTILAPLGERLRILAIDLRGHGASTLPAAIEGRQGWLEFRDDLLALLAAACEAPAVLAGHSMGGTTSLLAAAAEPDRVRALALFDPVVFPVEAQAAGGAAESPLVAGALRRRATFPSRAAAFEAYRGRGAFRTWRDEQLLDYVAAGFRETPDGEMTLTCTPQWEASNFRTHNYDPWAAFHASRCPIRVLRAEEASTFRLEGHEGDLGGDGRIQVETVPGTTHFLPMERPDLVRATLEASAAL